MIEADRPTALIVTALDVETKAVRRHMGNRTEEVDGNGTVYYRGTFEGYDVVVVEGGAGNIRAGILTAVAATQLRPDVCLFVGVAGGVKDVKLGDIVAATKVYGYESGKDVAREFLPRPDVGQSAHALVQRARAMRKHNEWRARLTPGHRKIKSRLFVEPIAAGEKVVASKRAETAELLEKLYSDAVAVEMEGRGFLEAAHVGSTVAIVIRGISDRLSKKANADKAGWQRKAAAMAAAVAFEMLSKLRSAKPLTIRQPKLPPAGPAAKKKKAGLTRRGAGRGKLRQNRGGRTARISTAITPAPAPAAVAIPPFQRMPSTVNEGAFYAAGEVLARVGVPDVDEVQFSFEEPPDGFIRIIPRIANAQPIPIPILLQAARNAPLLKHRQYGGFADVNAHGAIAYDPGGPHRGGPAPLAWGTQLFPNGELWLASNTVVVRERGGRPAWVPIPFIPAFVLEDTFYQKAHAAVAFAVSQLGLRFPADLELGVLGLEGVHLGIHDQDIRGPIRMNKIVSAHELQTGTAAEINQALLAFFERIYGATGHERGPGLFHFPPGPPRAGTP